MQQQSIAQDNRFGNHRNAEAAEVSAPAGLAMRALTKRIEENATIFSQFNVMPGRPVEETLFVREYRVGDRYIEATFDRHYKSTMLNSPDHLIFITALVHTQKLLYAILCHEFGLDYDPNQAEKLKIWPTDVHVRMPKMVTKTTDVNQTLTVERITEVSAGKFRIRLSTVIENLIEINADTVVYLL